MNGRGVRGARIAVLVSSVGIGVVLLALGIASVASGGDGLRWFLPAIVLTLCGTAIQLVLRRRQRASSRSRASATSGRDERR